MADTNLHKNIDNIYHTQDCKPTSLTPINTFTQRCTLVYQISVSPYHPFRFSPVKMATVKAVRGKGDSSGASMQCSLFLF